MSTPNPLAAIERMEAAAFRVSRVTRQLLADHPDLPMKDLLPGAVTIGRTEIDFSAGSIEGATAWAEALGVELTRTSHPDAIYGWHGYEAAHVSADIGGVHVRITGTRSLTAAEAAVRQAAKATPAGAPAEGGGG